MAADVHSVVGVQEQARETSCKVTHKIIWDGAQGLLHFGRQLPVMVLLWRKTTGKAQSEGLFRSLLQTELLVFLDTVTSYSSLVKELNT